MWAYDIWHGIFWHFPCLLQCKFVIVYKHIINRDRPQGNKTSFLFKSLVVEVAPKHNVVAIANVSLLSTETIYWANSKTFSEHESARPVEQVTHVPKLSPTQS